MALTPVHLFGPVQDTNNDADIAYTLAGGESVAAGHSLVVYVASAGSALGVIQSIADTQGNIYQPIVVESPGGSIGVSAGLGTMIVPLGPGDVITVTLGHVCTDKELVIHELSSVAQVSAIDKTAANGLSGSGSNTPNATTVPNATDTAHEYIGKITAWNGNAILNPDPGYTPLASGHFDNLAIPQTKQWHVGYKITTATGVQSVSESFQSGATQPWAVALFGLREAVAGGGGTAKVVPRGMQTRGSFGNASNLVSIPSGYSSAYTGQFIDLSWRDIQPTDTNALDPTMKAQVTAWLNQAQAAGKTVMLRFFACQYAPQWERDKVGQMLYCDPYSTPLVAKPLHKFWTPQSIADYDRVQALMAAEWDAHPALRAVFLGLAGTQYPEQMQRGFADIRNRAEYVGGGAGWAGTQIAVPGAGYTNELNKAAVKAGIDIHASRWPTTPAAMSMNPYQLITDVNTWQNQDDKNLTQTKEIIDYFIAALAGTKRCILANNSIRDSYFNVDGSLITTTKYGQMYVYLASKKVPRHYQCATTTRVGSLDATMAGAVGPLKANSVEPPTNQGTSPYDHTNMEHWNAELLTNPIPLIDSYIPVSTLEPAVSVVTAGGAYIDGNTLRSTLGGWDGGPNAITGYTINWWRIDPLTGDKVGSAVRTHTYTNKAATDDYTLVVGDRAYEIISEVTAVNADGTSDPRPSEPTPTIAASAPPPNTITVLPVVSTPRPSAGDVLEWTTGTWDGTPQPLSYQWTVYRSKDAGVTWESVQVGSSNQYPTSLQDVGYLFYADVVAYNGSFSSPASAAPTAAVNAAPILTISSPAQLTTVLAQVRPSYTIAGTATPRAGVPITSITISGQAVAFDSAGNFTGSVTIAGDGVNTYPVVAVDQNGNRAEVDVVFVVPLGAIVISLDMADIELRIRQRGIGS